MKQVAWVILTFAVHFIDPVVCVSKRKIYTLFTEKKTWNEARDICESQFGQLLKLHADRQKFELQALDNYVWGGAMTTGLSTGDPLLLGLHRPSPYNNQTTTHQDCEEYDNTANTFSVHGNTGRCGAIFTNFTSIHFIDCDIPGIFVCERLQDDCWFEPVIEFYGFTTEQYITQESVPAISDVNNCALLCRNYLTSGDECWGLFYEQASSNCMIFKVSLTNPAEDSSYFMDSALINTLTDSDNVLYIRRCFEGLIDSKEYPDFVNNDTEATASDCSLSSYQNVSTAYDICFCSVDTQPPIPPPISSEDRAAELVAELTIETSNTSAAIRKLTSAEDNRPSAVSVGAVGVALLTLVFGSLMLMDLNVAIAALKNLFGAIKSASAAANAAVPTETRAK